MEVKTNGIMANNSSSSASEMFGNKENPWDFIEQEILEFQSIVKELEDYSAKSSAEGSTGKGSIHYCNERLPKPDVDAETPTSPKKVAAPVPSKPCKHVKISTAPPTMTSLKHSPPPPPPDSPTKRAGEKPKPPPKPTLKLKPTLPPKTIDPAAALERKKSVDGKVKGVPNYTTV